MQLVPLETDLVLFDKRLKKTGSYIASVKKRVNDTEILLNLEPNDKSDKIELKNWEDKFSIVLSDKEYSKFPSMNDILLEYSEKAAKNAADKLAAKEKAKRDEEEAIRRAKFRKLGDPVHINLNQLNPESLNKVKELRKTKYFGETRTFGPSEIGAEVGTIKNYKGLNTIHTKERVLIRRDGRKTSFEKDTPPWMGPGYYNSSKAETFLGPKTPALEIPFKTVSREANPIFGALDHDEVRDKRLTAISSRRSGRSRTPSPQKDTTLYFSTLAPCDRLIRTMSRGLDVNLFNDDSSSGMFIKSIGDLPKTMRNVSLAENGKEIKKRRDFCGGGLFFQNEEPLDGEIDYIVEDEIVEAINEVRQRCHQSVESKNDMYKIKSIEEAGLELEVEAKVERARAKALQDAKKKEQQELKNNQQNGNKTKVIQSKGIIDKLEKDYKDDENHKLLYHPLKKKKIVKFKIFSEKELTGLVESDPIVKEVYKNPSNESISPVLQKWYSEKKIYSPMKQPRTTGFLSQCESLQSHEISSDLLLDDPDNDPTITKIFKGTSGKNTRKSSYIVNDTNKVYGLSLKTKLETLDLPRAVSDYLDDLSERAKSPLNSSAKESESEYI